MAGTEGSGELSNVYMYIQYIRIREDNKILLYL